MKSKTSRVWNYITEFGKTTTLHGIVHLVEEKRHWAEIYLWGIIVCLATGGSVLLIYNSWFRYHTNPTVISLQKDYRTWNLPFPAATVCFADKLNMTLANNLTKTLWKSIDETKYNYYMEFLNDIANIRYGNLEKFDRYQDDKVLTKLNLMEIAHQVTVKMFFHATIFNPKYKDMEFVETFTEMGFCYTYSGVLTQFIALLYEKPVNQSFIPPYCNFLNSLCYTRIEDLPVNITYYIHSPYEIPDITAKTFTVMTMMERDTTFKFLETIASSELRGLTPEQRRCRFFDEPLKGWTISRYSYNLCIMECRRELAFKFCGCAPHFYIKNEKIPTCDMKGLVCLAPHTEEIITLFYNNQRFPCSCFPTCEDINLYVDKNTIREWTYPVPCNIRFRYAIESYSKTQLRRDIIFGFEDLLVSFGGTAALFLGCSLLTFVEIFYFFGLRLFWYVYSNKRSSHRSRKVAFLY